MHEGDFVPDWPFEDPANTAAITTRLVLDDGAPILLVTHDLEDGGYDGRSLIFRKAGAPGGRMWGPRGNAVPPRHVPWRCLTRECVPLLMWQAA
jgi:hypothetical protein